MKEKMPAIFVGHGSPMNAIENNKYTNEWVNIGSKLQKPKAILSVSAHWYTSGTRITDSAKPEIVYDMYGFPEELYKIAYRPDGFPELAHETKNLITSNVTIDNTWGIDHGTWSVLCRMFPDADIPVFQLSIDKNADAATHYKIGKELQILRENGVMIFASGNVVHNLSSVNWNMDNGYGWADEFDNYIKDKILSRKFEDVINYKQAGEAAKLSFYMPDHFYPLLYVLGASFEDDIISVFNNSCTLGSLSMTSFMFN